MADSGRTCRTSCSGGPDDVDHEVQRVGALDPGLGVARLAVPVLRRDLHDDPAPDALAHEPLDPAGDDATARAGRELEARRRVAVEVLVEGLLALVHLTEVAG